MAGKGKTLDLGQTPAGQSSKGSPNVLGENGRLLESQQLSSTCYCMGEELKVPLMKLKRTKLEALFLGFDDDGYALVRPKSTHVEKLGQLSELSKRLNDYHTFSRRSPDTLKQIRKGHVFVLQKHQTTCCRVEFMEYDEKKEFVTVRDLDTGGVLQAFLSQLYRPNREIFCSEPFHMMKCKLSGLGGKIGSTLTLLQSVYVTLVQEKPDTFTFEMLCKVQIEQYTEHPVVQLKVGSKSRPLTSDIKEQIRCLRERQIQNQSVRH